MILHKQLCRNVETNFSHQNRLPEAFATFVYNWKCKSSLNKASNSRKDEIHCFWWIWLNLNLLVFRISKDLYLVMNIWKAMVFIWKQQFSWKAVVFTWKAMVFMKSCSFHMKSNGFHGKQWFSCEKHLKINKNIWFNTDISFWPDLSVDAEERPTRYILFYLRISVAFNMKSMKTTNFHLKTAWKTTCKEL